MKHNKNILWAGNYLEYSSFRSKQEPDDTEKCNARTYEYLRSKQKIESTKRQNYQKQAISTATKTRRLFIMT